MGGTGKPRSHDPDKELLRKAELSSAQRSGARPKGRTESKSKIESPKSKMMNTLTLAISLGRARDHPHQARKEESPGATLNSVERARSRSMSFPHARAKRQEPPRDRRGL